MSIEIKEFDGYKAKSSKKKETTKDKKKVDKLPKKTK